MGNKTRSMLNTFYAIGVTALGIQNSEVFSFLQLILCLLIIFNSFNSWLSFYDQENQ